MNGIATNGTAFRTHKFGKINLVENGLVLIKKNKEQTDISFSELNKIYIKKYKLSFINKTGILLILLILPAISSIYLSKEIVVLTLILFIPLTVKINTYKRYQLHILLNDGTFFIKNLKKDAKQDHINLVNLFRKEIFDNRVKYNFQRQTPSTNETLSKDYAYSSLRIT